MINHVTIEEKVQETPTVFSMYFRWEMKVMPGQFVMVWVPGFSEVPMSLSSTGERKCLTVKVYGETTARLAALNTGDRIYLRGPYGKPFTPTEGKKLLIGGGSGMASMRPLIDDRATGIIASRNADELLFADHFKEGQAICVTEDGSRGMKGLAPDALDKLNLKEFDAIYVCGPERMMYAIFQKLKGKDLNVEFSLERSMKCGIGLCDSCSIDGFQVCRDGPTFHIKALEGSMEFGKTKLLSSGKRVYF